MKKQISILVLILVAIGGVCYMALSREQYKSGGWSWHQRPIAVHYDGTYDKTYWGWIDGEGNLGISSYDHDTGLIANKRLATLSAKDDHCSPSILIRNSDHKVIVFWAGHDGNYWYWAISSNAEDISDFGTTSYLGPDSSYTYTQPIELTAEGKIYLFCRRKIGVVRCWDIFVSTDNGASFTKNTNPLWYESDANTPYTEVCSNNVDTIWFARSDWMSGEASYVRKYLTFCYYTDGSFYKADGTKICDWGDLPITDRDNLEMIWDSDDEDKNYVYAKDIEVDGDGYPVILFTTLDDDLGDNHYYYARWTGLVWNINKICTAGETITEVETQPAYEGGIALNHEDVNEVVLSREVSTNHWEVERWRTTDEGTTWGCVETITAGDATLPAKQLRPIIPYNHHHDLPVLWLSGTYDNYDDFALDMYLQLNTSIGLTRISSGLRLIDQFTDGDYTASPVWTVDSGTVAVIDVGGNNKLKLTRTSGASARVRTPCKAFQDAVLLAKVQLRSATTTDIRIMWSDDDLTERYYYKLYGPTPYRRLGKYVGNNETALDSDAGPLDTNENTLALSWQNRALKCYMNGSEILADDLDGGHDSLPYICLLVTGSTSPLDYAYFDDVIMMDSFIVTVQGLPSGYKARVTDGSSNTAVATEGNGIASVDCSTLVNWPCPTLDVLDGSDNVITTYNATNVYGGDYYNYSVARKRRTVALVM